MPSFPQLLLSLHHIVKVRQREDSTSVSSTIASSPSMFDATIMTTLVILSNDSRDRLPPRRATTASAWGPIRWTTHRLVAVSILSKDKRWWQSSSSALLALHRRPAESPTERVLGWVVRNRRRERMCRLAIAPWQQRWHVIAPRSRRRSHHAMEVSPALLHR